MVKKSKLILFLVFSCWILVSEALAQELPFPNPEQPISLDFKDASLKDILKIFSMQSGLNFIASEVVQDRRFTLYLENVPVKEAMDKIFKANNLTYELDPQSKIFIVKEWGKPAIETMVRIFPLKYARVPSSNLNREVSSALGATPEAAPGATPGAVATGQGIIEAVKLILSEQGKITEDARTNSLIIIDVPAKFPLIEETISALDKPVPQVLIEVEMLDVTKSTVDKMGVKFGAEWLRISGALSEPVYKAAPGRIFTHATLSGRNFSAILEFLTTQSDTKYLARPRILTLSNETAEIKITTQEAIGLEIETGRAEGAGIVTRKAEREETGVSLKVTPQVNLETREITLLLEPKVKEAKTGATFDATTFKDPEERGAKSIVRVKDGQTIIIGGLIRTEFSSTLVKVPFLGDVPFLGALFRHRYTEPNKERELLIFITPHIVEEEITAKVEIEPEFLEREQDPLILKREEVIKKTLKNLGKE